MTPMGEDPNVGEAALRALRMLHESVGSFFVYALPAFIGAIVGACRKDRRKKKKRLLVLSFVMSWLVGCGITPLFAHVFGIPENTAQSLAFFLGVWGIEGLDVLWGAFRNRAAGKESRPGDEEEM
jgi:hypothetical protein